MLLIASCDMQRRRVLQRLASVDFDFGNFRDSLPYALGRVVVGGNVKNVTRGLGSSSWIWVVIDKGDFQVSTSIYNFRLL